MFDSPNVRRERLDWSRQTHRGIGRPNQCQYERHHPDDKDDERRPRRRLGQQSIRYRFSDVERLVLKLERFDDTVMLFVFGLEDYILSSSVKFWPNPASENLNIQFPKTVDKGTFDIRVYSEVGAKVLEFASQQIDAGFSLRIPVQKLPKGIYFIEIENVSGRLKFIKN